MSELMDYDEFEPNEHEEKIEIEYSLTSYGIDFDVSGLVRRFDEGTIYAPKFQRNFVWNISKASKFIESLLLGLPVPGIFLLNDEKTQKFLIIDGLQRLTSLSSFLNNKFDGKQFKLIDVNSNINKLTIDEISPALRLKLQNTVLHATVIKPDDPKSKNTESIFLIFERLNTGGINLSPQEIRNCIYQGEFLDEIIELGNLKEFISLLNIDTKRKKNEEICLRLLALTYNINSYSGDMKGFLNDFIDNNKNFEKIKKEEIIKIFKETLHIITEYLQPDIFKGPVNFAILDSIFVGIAKTILDERTVNPNDLKIRINNLIQTEKYLEYIKTGRTHYTDNVKNRINLVYEELK
jgi:uncharacterized protein with ParB-like and HNH nuclease domain